MSTATVTVTVDPVNDVLSLTSDSVDVYESNLADGTTPSGDRESDNGSFTIEAYDGLASITVHGQVITAAQLDDLETGSVSSIPITTPTTYGTLELTGYTSNPATGGGVVTYTYTLSGNTLDHSVQGNDSVSESIDISVTDDDGDSFNATITVTVVDDVPIAEDNNGGSVEEGGDTITSSVSVLDNDEAGADEPVIINGFTYTDETGTLQTGTLGTEVDTQHGRFTLNSDGSWSYTSDDSEDHSSTDSLQEVITYTIEDADGDVDTANLTISVTDDEPSTSSSTAHTYEVPQQDTNVLITLDVSGSMADGLYDDSFPSGNDSTRMDVAVESVAEMLSQYDYRGDVRVKLVVFSTYGDLLVSEWVTVDEAKIIMNNLVANGGTNYDSALQVADNAYDDTTGMISGADNVAYFISDGLPSLPPGSDQGIQSGEQSVWEAFLETNNVTSYAIAMGDLGSSTITELAPIAYDANADPGEEQIEPIVVTDPNDLEEALLDTLDVVPITGTLQGSFGADGGYVHSIIIGGVTYTYDPSGGGSISSTGTFVFDTTTNTMTVETGEGGELSVDMDTGEYSYTAPQGITAMVDDVFQYRFADNDGDVSDTGTVTVTLVPPGGTDIIEQINEVDSFGVNGTGSTLNGGVGDDFLVGGTGADTLNGGAGDDILNGDGGYQPYTSWGYVSSAYFTDTVNGGDGNDRVIYDGRDTVDGGDGLDTLILEKDLDINFNTNRNLSNIEVIDLTYGPGSDSIFLEDVYGYEDMPYYRLYDGDHRLTNINAADVLNMTDADNELYILGDSGDYVEFDGFTLSGTASADVYSDGTDTAFNVYTGGGATVYVDQDITVSL